MSIGGKALYQPRDAADLRDLLAAQPLAFIVSGGAAQLCVTPLPVRLQFDDMGLPAALVGHFGRGNAQLQVLATDPEAMILLMGPQAYVSPSWFADRTQAPTWNYACAVFHVRIELEDDAERIGERLTDLIDAVEAGRPHAWRTQDMGTRYASLARGVVAFRAAIVNWHASFKLGQDERDDVFADMLIGLRAEGEQQLVSWMERFAGNDRMQRLPGSPAADRPPLDAAVARFVTAVVEDTRRLSAGRTVDLAMQRRIAEQVRRPWTQGGPRMRRVAEFDVPGAAPSRLRIYEPDTVGDLPALFYVHGGGWTLFSLDTHDRLMREYAQRAGVVVIGIDYALSPEQKYPYALRQTVAALRWLRGRPDLAGIDISRLVLAGDSAGANLAIAAALALRDADELDDIAGLLLNYGAFDAEVDADSRRRLGSPADMLTADEVDIYWDNYLRTEADRRDPLACPLRAALHGLPPTLLIVPECDVLAAQSAEMTQRLLIAGVPALQKTYAGATHSFLEATTHAPLAIQAIEDAAHWLRDRFSSSGLGVNIHV
jgi:acetyl esterase